MSDPTTPATGLAVPVALPPSLRTLRRRYDRAALAGAGAHVTVLYPFLPVAALGPSLRQELAAIAADEPPFEVHFTRVRRFEGELVWVEPADPRPFHRLMAAVTRCWPEHPPYAGLFDDPIVHATVVESETAPLASIEAAVVDALPFTSPATRMELWRQDEEGRWRPQWRLALGSGTRR